MTAKQNALMSTFANKRKGRHFAINLFEVSLESGFFTNKLKIARVIPIFKAGDPDNISNYRPISVLPCFSKMSERIMYNRLSKDLITEKILYPFKNF